MERLEVEGLSDINDGYAGLGGHLRGDWYELVCQRVAEVEVGVEGICCFPLPPIVVPVQVNLFQGLGTLLAWYVFISHMGTRYLVVDSGEVFVSELVEVLVDILVR